MAEILRSIRIAVNISLSSYTPKNWSPYAFVDMMAPHTTGELMVMLNLAAGMHDYFAHFQILSN